MPEVASRHHLELVNPVVDAALAEAGVGLAERRLDRGHPRARARSARCWSGSARRRRSRRRPASRCAASTTCTGHVAANFLEPDPIEPPFLCLIASGGHTLLAGVHGRTTPTRCSARRSTTPPARRSTRRRGCSGLGYPGGPAIEREAADGDPAAFAFPVAMTNDPRLDFSFSGLKTALLYAVRDLGAGRGSAPARRPRGELSGRRRRPAGRQAAPRARGAAGAGATPPTLARGRAGRRRRRELAAARAGWPSSARPRGWS